MEKELTDFAHSNEGKNLIRLHNAGYPLTTVQRELTPLQQLFLVIGINIENKEQEEGTKSGSSQSAKTTLEQLRQLAKERSEKQWQQ